MTAVPTALDTAASRKARGAFFTPEPVAKYITAWGVRSATDHILEPSCGEASFLLAAVERLSALRLTDTPDRTGGALDGVELHEASAAAARALLDVAGVNARIKVDDFFDVEPTGSYDVVIGNPPYVRYQDFSGEARARSRAAALRAGVSLTNLASSWAAFTVHSALFLKRGGRLGLVLPAELLSVNYAADVRGFLLREFAKVHLVMFTERVFPGVLEDVVLLLADGYRDGPTDHATVVEAKNAAELGRVRGGRRWRPTDPRAKWTPSLLPASALHAYTRQIGREAFAPLEAWGDTTLGMVTGNNKYFALSPAEVSELGLHPSDLLPLSPPGSRHLRGLAFTGAAREEIGRRGEATWLFRPAGTPSPAGQDYIAAGAFDGVPKAYKCRVRSPWWRVPLVPPADLFLTCMNADTPRLTTNTAQVYNLNSVHGVYLRDGVRARGRELLPIASLNTLTLLGAELVGRAYGGGMLKLEPREADILPVPAAELVGEARAELSGIRGLVESALLKGDLLGAVSMVDDVLLRRMLSLDADEHAALVEARAQLSARRSARGARPTGQHARGAG